MTFQKPKTVVIVLEGRHRSATTNIVGDITFNEETGKKFKLFFGRCLKCDRKKFITVSDNTIADGQLSDFIKILGKKD